MRSSSDGLARPVRTVENSCWADSTDLTIRSAASSSSSSITFSAILLSSRCRYQGADALARDYPRQARVVVHVEDVQRHAVVHAERQCRGAHHTQATLDRLH